MIGSKSAYARHLNKSPAAVTKYTQKPWFPVLADGRIDFDAADAALAANLDQTRGGKGGGPDRSEQAAPGEQVKVSPPELPEAVPGRESFSTERARREAAERKLKELELARQLGEVVEAGAFAKGMEEAAGACRKEIEGMVQRLPSLVAAEHDVRRCRELIEAEVTRAMTTLADTCAAIAARHRSATRQ